MKLNHRILVWTMAVFVFGSAAGLGLRAEIGTDRRPAGSEQDASNKSATEGSHSDRVALGKQIFHYTPDEAKPYVGNRLSCNSCHALDGTVPHASPMIGVAKTFPQFNQRANRVINLKDRIQECFVRSENGHPLPEDGREMMALVAYIDSLSLKTTGGKEYSGRGLVKVPDLKGNPERGEKIYLSKCAVCHGYAGEGVGPMLPPVWGDGSFNDGAGMHKVEKWLPSL